MSRFVDRFETHELHRTLKNILEIVTELLEREEEETQTETIIELDRAKQVCFNVERILSNCDPNIVHIGYLDNVNSNLVNYIIPYLHSFRNDRNVTHLYNVNNQLDSLLPTISSFLIQDIPSNTDGIKESISSFRRSISQRLRHTEEEFNRIESVGREIEQGLSQVSSTVEMQKSRLDTAISEFQQQFSQAEDIRRQQFSNTEEERRKDHEKHEEKWREKFGDLAEYSSENIETLINGLKLKVKRIEEQYNDECNQYIGTLENYKNEAAKILNIISNTSMAGGYKKEADHEGKARQLWRTVTMVAMLLLVIASVWSFAYPIKGDSVWIEVARRVSVAATFATVAGYSARQAKIHFDAERLFRKMELELTSLSPYLVELEDTKRQEILAKMAEQFFGKANIETLQTSTTQPTPETFNKITELSKLLENALSLLKDKK
ncbi:hypothetical protein COE92_16250 [Bacillus wiedmannii]|uniref:hypothetical protein n=1 Tax=Bacillus wiedmannii TaxID=1890302 RepID=UPI000BFB2586|nr:hypothetical protein [Bacillus wiedmannii]PHB53946.1 hypothetical protein COE92_16250 [Bacillus wiedmannii]